MAVVAVVALNTDVAIEAVVVELRETPNFVAVGAVEALKVVVVFLEVWQLKLLWHFERCDNESCCGRFEGCGTESCGGSLGGMTLKGVVAV